jgi:hypothetical protein
VADPVMMPDGTDLVAVVVRGLSSHGAEDGQRKSQGQDGDYQFFHRNAQNHEKLRLSVTRAENL